MSLWSQFLTNDQRIIQKWKHYFPIYESHFQVFVNKTVTFIEIGCGEGGSLQMWKRYFGPYARIIGIDIDQRCRAFKEDQIEVRIGAQQDAKFLQSLIDEFGMPDIVLDDGSHIMSHVRSSFAFLYPQLSKSGVYMIEDLHTAYWEEFEGGLDTPGSFIEISKHLIDELNADHTRGAVMPTEFTRTTLSMHYYDSMIVFERGRHTRKFAPRIGNGMTSASNEIAGNEGPTGFLDQIRDAVIQGWAYDSGASGSTEINISIEAESIGTAVAGALRLDLVEAGIGNGYHGFALAIPPDLRFRQDAKVIARYRTTGKELIGSGRTVGSLLTDHSLLFDHQGQRIT